jgi:hypothetical protein
VCQAGDGFTRDDQLEMQAARERVPLGHERIEL